MAFNNQALRYVTEVLIIPNLNGLKCCNPILVKCTVSCVRLIEQHQITIRRNSAKREREREREREMEQVTAVRPRALEGIIIRIISSLVDSMVTIQMYLHLLLEEWLLLHKNRVRHHFEGKKADNLSHHLRGILSGRS